MVEATLTSQTASFLYAHHDFCFLYLLTIAHLLCPPSNRSGVSWDWGYSCYLFVVHHLTLQLLLRFLAIMVTAAVSNYWVLIPAVLVMTIFLAFRWYYLKTSREIKRLEAIGMFYY